MARRIGIAAFTRQGRELAGRIAGCLASQPEWAGCEVALYERNLKEWCRAQFESRSDGIIFVGACGIAVRAVAPFLKSKTEDPAVVVADEAGRYVISLLSGHIGGANRLALAVARMIGAEPVITTATDVNGKFAADVFAKDNRLLIGSMEAAKKVSAAILRGEAVGLWCGGRIEGEVPPELTLLNEEEPCWDGRRPACVICIAEQVPGWLALRCRGTKDGRGGEIPLLHLIPRNYILGLGCRKGKTAGEIEEEAGHFLALGGISEKQVSGAASIDLKKEEWGLLEFCSGHGLALTTYSAQELAAVKGEFSSSEFVQKTTGVGNVCERAALLLAGKGGRLVLGKYANNGVTAALAAGEWSVRFGK